MKRWAAIFDWDGVIIDSSRQHEGGWELLAREEGRTLPPGVFKRSFGMKNEKVITELLSWTTDLAEIRRLSLRKEEFYRELLRRDGTALLPGTREWLDRLRAEKVPCAVGSSTPRLNIDCVLELLGIGSYFDAFVTAEDVSHGKPDPEVFLAAATRLGTPPERCVVFEDAHVGIEAALRAGMKVIALTTTHPAETLGGANRIVNRLDELELEEVAAWFA